jgi:hypothetical protein
LQTWLTYLSVNDSWEVSLPLVLPGGKSLGVFTSAIPLPDQHLVSQERLELAK